MPPPDTEKLLTNWSISLSWAGRIEGECRQLLKAKQWCVVAGSAVVSAFFQCGCGLVLLTVFLLSLLVACPVTV